MIKQIKIYMNLLKHTLRSMYKTQINFCNVIFIEVKKNMYICKKLKQNIMETNIEISKGNQVANIPSINELVELFINSLDTKDSSKNSYKRALSQ